MHLKIVRNHQGFSFTTMLGIISLVMVIITSIFVYVINSTILIEKGLDLETKYNQAFQNVETTLNVIVREESTDPTFLLGLSTYMGVTISALANDVYEISDTYSDTKELASYFKVSSGGISTYDSFLQFTGTEPGFSLNPLITAETMLSNYFVELWEARFPAANPPDPNATFSETITYVQYLVTQGTFLERTPAQLTGQTDPTVDNFWYISGNVSVPNKKNLTILDGYVLVINGNLTMGQNSTFSGIVIVNGNVTINGASNKWETFEGTAYCSGSFLADPKLYLGTSSRPSFVFAMQDITIDENTRNDGYFLSNRFLLVGTKNITITGGIYVTTSAQYPPGGISLNTDLLEVDLFGYGVTKTISSSSGSFSIIYTSPRNK